jgi:hypothetical protein
MLVPIRDAISPAPDPQFARRTAIVTGLTTMLVLGAGVFALSSAERPDPATSAATVPAFKAARAAPDRTPSVDHHAVWAELRTYAFEAYPMWAVDYPDRECPRDLLEVNRYAPNLHAVDPWGSPYQFQCGRQWNIRGLLVRSAGPDARFDTTDDLSSLD